MILAAPKVIRVQVRGSNAARRMIIPGAILRRYLVLLGCGLLPSEAARLSGTVEMVMRTHARRDPNFKALKQRMIELGRLAPGDDEPTCDKCPEYRELRQQVRSIRKEMWDEDIGELDDE